MANVKFDNVKVLLIDSEIGSRDSIKGALHNVGFRDFRTGKTLHEVVSGLNQFDPDLLICGTQFDEGDPAELVKKVRHSEIGPNPFLPIIFMTSEASKKIVTASLNAGADILLVKPISINDITGRISSLITNRKSFVVTTDYVGPDRRKGGRKDAEEEDGIEQIEVPNRLKAKATGDKEALDDQDFIKNSLTKINGLKLERHAVQIGFLVEMILPAYEKGDITHDLVEHIDKINHVAADTAKRLRHTEYDHVSELCKSLLSVSRDIRKNYKAPKPKDLKLLRPLAQAIGQAFAIKEDVAALAARISEKIKNRQAS